MTTAIPHTHHIFGPAYVTLLRQDFKHLSRTEHYSKGANSNLRRKLKAIAKTYLSRYHPQSMVKAEGPAHHKKSPPRSAGQATSPQNIAVNTTPTPPASRRVSPSVDNSRNHGQLQPSQTSMAAGCHHRSQRSTMTSSSFARGYRGSSAPAEDSDSDSSTSSDEDVSDISSRATSPETDLPHHETVLQRKKREIVDSSMDVFVHLLYHWFIEEFGTISHGAGGRGGKRSRDTFECASDKSPFNGGQKRQLDEDRNLGGGGNDEGEGKGDGGEKKRAKRLDVDGLLFGCPFFKQNPAKYGKIRTCLGPGFATVHRLKEHLWRKHLLPKYCCPRCHAGFRTKDEFNAHLRASVQLQCPISEEAPPEGIDEDKEKKIRDRKTRKNMTEAQKWEEIFQIIFPDALIPSPYMDHAEAKPSSPQQMTEQVSRAKAAHYMKRLVPEVRRQLQREVDREFEGVSERVKDKTLELVQDAMTKVIRVWEHSGGRSQAPSSRSSPAPDSGLATPEPQALVSSAPPPVPVLVEGFADPVSVFSNADFSFELGDEDFLNQLLEAGYDEDQVAWDSAYGTHDGLPVENCV